MYSYLLFYTHMSGIKKYNENKPENVVDKIAQGKLEKFYQENALLEQTYIKDPNTTVKELIANTIGKIGENITIRRFVRFQLGE